MDFDTILLLLCYLADICKLAYDISLVNNFTSVRCSIREDGMFSYRGIINHQGLFIFVASFSLLMFDISRATASLLQQLTNCDEFRLLLNW